MQSAYLGAIDLTQARFANIENATLLEAAGASNITGTTVANVLIGNTSANRLTGDAGNDTLIGGGGDDTLDGGAGDDTYFVDSTTDQIIDSGGTDTVLAAMDWSLTGSSMENLTLLGGVWANATGNTLNNALTGNDGNNKLDGGAGDDNMVGGLGDDTYVIDSANDKTTEALSAGTDTVQSGYVADIDLGTTRFVSIENATLLDAALGSKLIGTSGDNVLIGNASNNTLTGKDGNDWLDGGIGNDALTGGIGDDTYVVDSSLDTMTEKSGEGRDTVRSSITISGLLTNFEDIVLTGSQAIDATGNTVANRITGNSAINTLKGGGGIDTLDGGGGSDTLIGNAGNDTYVVNNLGVTIQEVTGEGTDTLETSLTMDSDLVAFVENVTLTGAAAINARGNSLANLLVGNAANNSLDGLTGKDTLRGGAGDDTYYVDMATDSVEELLNEGHDKVFTTVTYTLASYVEDLELSASATTISGTGNDGDNRLVGNSSVNTLTALGGNDTLNGGGGADKLYGGAGDDWYELAVSGATIYENLNDGTDTVLQGYSSTANLAGNVENLILTGTGKFTGTGNTGDNQLTGNDNNNTLNGKDGNDTLFGAGGEDSLVGGKGNDVFIVNSSGDTVTEAANEGTDTVRSDMTVDLTNWSAVELAELTGSAAANATGNTLFNELIGNSAANKLDGGAGDDTMRGGLGDDTYIRDSLNDVIDEAWGAGIDTVQSSVSTTLESNVENLVLTSGTGATGTGNELDNQLIGGSGADKLIGSFGNDTLDGGTFGKDTLEGGDGDDLYLIGAPDSAAQARSRSADLTDDFALDPRRWGGRSSTTRRRVPVPAMLRTEAQLAAPSTDEINEALYAGVDTVRSSITYTLTDNVENLELTGPGALSGTGNALDNRLTGNSGKNTLTGGDGNDTLDGGTNTDPNKADTLKGGKGDDTFIIHTNNDIVTELAGAGTGNDTVMRDFNSTNDLAANVENLVLLGAADINGKGNSGKNTLTGNDGKNTLDGGGDDDVMAGGKGDDTYMVDTVGDKVVEKDLGYGNDTVVAGVTVDLGKTNYLYVENVTLSGGQNLDATGSIVANLLVGNSGNNQLLGLAGDDTLDGGSAGTDVLAGGQGNDTYILRAGSGLTLTELAGEGSDTVLAGFTLSLGSYLNIENAALTGGANLDLTGDAADNRLTGNDGSNRINGGAGNDTMIGGKGDDTYVFDSNLDQLRESAGEGTDTMEVSNFTGDLRADAFVNIENLTLTGSAALEASGDEGNNRLTGNNGNNLVLAREGNDTILGGDGNDTLQGNEGNDELIDDRGALDDLWGNTGADIYRIGAASAPGSSRYVKVHGGSDGDVVYLAAGIKPEDVIRSVSADGFSLILTIKGTNVASFQVELTNQFGGGKVNEVRFESYPNVVWSGSDLAGNAIVGTEGDDDLRGQVYKDIPEYIMGLGGNDSLYGFEGDDTLVGGAGNDWMCGHEGDDVFEFDADAGTDLAWEQANGGNDTIRFVGGIKPADVQLFRVGGDLQGVGKESLVLRVAATGAQIWMRDFFLEEGNGKGTIERFQFADGTVWTYADIVARVGPAPQANTQTGTSNDDSFTVDHYADVVNDSNSADHDTITTSITFTLPDNVERLAMTGTLDLNASGNAENNEIVGNAGNNVIDGKDGYDILTGGRGNDIYFDREPNVDGYGGPRPEDTIIEATGEGIDSVTTNHAYRTLEDNVENMRVEVNTPYYYHDYGNGNRINFDRVYKGNALDNRIQVDIYDGPLSRLDGGLGNDTLIGGSGNQIYVVDSLGDRVVDASQYGHDLVESAVTFTLGNNLEDLTLTGSQAATGTGNELANALDGSGNTAANALYGLANDDVYRLGAGDTAFEAANAGNDTVEVTDASFAASGVVDLASFVNIENLRVSFDYAAILTVLGTDGANKLSTPTGNARTVIDGRGGDDLLDESSYAMSMDTLLGGTGNDTLVSHGGEDWLDGGQGDDLYCVGYQIPDKDNYVPAHAGAHIRFGIGSGHDQAQFEGQYYWAEVEQHHGYYDDATYVYQSFLRNGWSADDWLEQSRPIAIDLDAGIDPTSLRFTHTGNDLTFTLATGDSLTVTNFFDVGANTVGSVIDQINFGGGAFILGAQMALAVGKTDFSTATASDDVLIAANGSSAQQSGGDGNDFIAGNALGQRQDGDLGSDSLVAGDGDDTLVGGAGDDTLCGGQGSDTYVFSSHWGFDTLNESNLAGLDGTEPVSVMKSPDGAPNVIIFDANVRRQDIDYYWDNGRGLYIRNVATGDYIYVTGDYQAQDGQDPYTNPQALIDRIEFQSDGTVWDRARIEWGSRVIEGTPGNDTLEDRDSGSRVYGYGGDDTLTAYCGGTELHGGDGNDTLTSYGYDVQLYGDAGQDRLTGSDDNDTLDGGTGVDTMTGGLGDDWYVIDNASDQLSEASGAGIDTVTTSFTITGGLMANFEHLYLAPTAGAIDGIGNTLANHIHGNDFANFLSGGSLNDTLDGGGGADKLDGGSGNDRLYGGLGADTYVFATGGDTIDETGNGSTDKDRCDLGSRKWEDVDKSNGFDFVKVGNDLEMRLKSAPTSKFIIKNWYLPGSDAKIEEFVFNSGMVVKTAADIEAKVQGIAPPQGEQSPVGDDDVRLDLMSLRPGHREVGDPDGQIEAHRRSAQMTNRLVDAMASFHQPAEAAIEPIHRSLALQSHLNLAVHQLPC